MAKSATSLEVRGLDAALEALKKLPQEVVSKKGGPVKLAMAKGARALRKELYDALAMAIAINGADSTGGTLAALKASRKRTSSAINGEKYLVGIVKKEYQNARKIKTNPKMTANLLEYGSKHQPATPWLRPTVAANAQGLVDSVIADLNKRIEKIASKLVKVAR